MEEGNEDYKNSFRVGMIRLWITARQKFPSVDDSFSSVEYRMSVQVNTTPENDVEYAILTTIRCFKS